MAKRQPCAYCWWVSCYLVFCDGVPHCALVIPFINWDCRIQWSFFSCATENTCANQGAKLLQNTTLSCVSIRSKTCRRNKLQFVRDVFCLTGNFSVALRETRVSNIFVCSSMFFFIRFALTLCASREHDQEMMIVHHQ